MPTLSPAHIARRRPTSRLPNLYATSLAGGASPPDTDAGTSQPVRHFPRPPPDLTTRMPSLPNVYATSLAGGASPPDVKASFQPDVHVPTVRHVATRQPAREVRPPVAEGDSSLGDPGERVSTPKRSPGRVKAHASRGAPDAAPAVRTRWLAESLTRMRGTQRVNPPAGPGPVHNHSPRRAHQGPAKRI